MIGERSDYYRSVVVPPVALWLSLFFSLVALVKLPVLLNELVYAMTKGRKDFRIWAKGLMVCGIAAIIVIPLMTPATTLPGKEQRVIGTVY